LKGQEFTLNSHRPFQILGIQQIAVGAANKHRLRTFWVDLLGLEYHKTFISETENVDEDICIIGSGDFAVEVDLMQPLDKTVKPRVDLPALNHVGLWVDDLSAAVDWLTSQGLRFTPGGIRQGAAGHDVCFVHPKGNEEFPLSAEGVLVELVQAPSRVIEAYKIIAEA
jgi:lactoylglutathione lyase